MRRKSLLTLVVIMCLVIATLSVSAVNQNSSRTKGSKEKQTEKFLSEVNTELYDEYDLGNKYISYVKLSYEDMSGIYSEKEIGINYNTIGHSELIKGIRLGGSNLDIGTTDPIILIKKNAKEVIFLYKDAVGNNCRDTYLYKSNNWILEETKEKGEIILFEDFDNDN